MIYFFHLGWRLGWAFCLKTGPHDQAIKEDSPPILLMSEAFGPQGVWCSVVDGSITTETSIRISSTWSNFSCTSVHWSSLSSQSAKQVGKPAGHTLFYFEHCQWVQHLLALRKMKEPKVPMTTVSCCAVAVVVKPVLKACRSWQCWWTATCFILKGNPMLFRRGFWVS